MPQQLHTWATVMGAYDRYWRDVEKFRVRAHIHTLFPSHLLPLYFPYPVDLFAIEYLRLRFL